MSPLHHRAAIIRAGRTGHADRREDVIGSIVSVGPHADLWIIVENILAESESITVISASGVGGRRDCDAFIPRRKGGVAGNDADDPAGSDLVVHHNWVREKKRHALPT